MQRSFTENAQDGAETFLKGAGKETTPNGLQKHGTA